MGLLQWLFNLKGKNDPDSQNARPDEYGRNGVGLSNPYREIGDGLTYATDRISDIAGKVWNDYTGQTQIQEQLQANKDLAAYQSQMQEEFYNKYSSPSAIMRQLKEAGLNPNLAYGSSGSGQSNVPSYTAPQAIRSMSGSQKLSAVMQLFSGLVNMRNIMYNTEAAREVSEQAQIKTQSLWQDLLSKTRNNILNDAIIGHSLNYNIKPFWKRSSPYETYFSADPSFLEYALAARQLHFNKSMSSYGKNLWEFGSAHNGMGVDLLPILSNQSYRNLILQYDYEQRKFNYDWDNQYRTMMKSFGIAGQLGASILRMLK